MKLDKSFLSVFFLFCFFIASAQTKKILHTVYLIGDAGEDEKPGKALLRLKGLIENDTNSTVVFLGDNVYPQGLNIKSESSKNILRSQLTILKGYKGRAYFIPGNHDWKAQKINGYTYVLNQQKFIDAYAKDSLLYVKNAKSGIFFPDNGTPGPNTFLIAPKLRLILIDSQWFLQQIPLHKVGVYSGVNVTQTKKMYYAKLDSILQKSALDSEMVIIATHHPLFSNGEHGKEKKFFVALVRYTPFQLFGLMGLNRLNSQNVAHPRYKKWKNEMLMILKKYNNIVFASGHDHNIQFLNIDGRNYIVSGAGSKTSKIKSNKYSTIGKHDSSTAFVRMEFYTDGSYKYWIELDLMKD